MTSKGAEKSLYYIVSGLSERRKNVYQLKAEIGHNFFPLWQKEKAEATRKRWTEQTFGANLRRRAKQKTSRVGDKML